MKQFKIIRGKKKIILYMPKDTNMIYRLPYFRYDIDKARMKEIQTELKSLLFDKFLLRKRAIECLLMPGYIIPSTEEKPRFYIKGIPFKYKNVTLDNEEIILAVRTMHLVMAFK